MLYLIQIQTANISKINQNKSMASAAHKYMQPSASTSHYMKNKQKQHSHKTNNLQSNKNGYNEIEDFRKKQQALVTQKNYSNLITGMVNLKKCNQNADKRLNTKNQTKKLKRPQTPEPTSGQNGNFQIFKYPEPEFILKQIQRNVNFLKQMYYASISQQNSTTQKNTNLIQSLIETQQSHRDATSQEFKGYKNLRKSVDTVVLNKKSVPQINLASNLQPYSMQNSLNLINKKSKQINLTEKVKNQNKSKNKNGTGKASKSKSQQRKTKQKKIRQNSNSNLHKQKNKRNDKCNQNKIQKKLKNVANKSQNLQQNYSNKQKINNQQNNPNINNLFEIFKYYKRSIDSNLSKRQSKTNIHKNIKNSNNSQNHKSINTCASTKNQNTLQEKSYQKQTPNNSTAKNTTNHKNSTMSRNYGSSIQASFEQNNRSSKVQGKSRRSSNSNSNKKDSSKRQQSKNQRQKNNQKIGKDNNKINKFITKQQNKDSNKNYYSQLNNKKQLKQKHFKKELLTSNNQDPINNFKKKSNSITNKNVKIQQDKHKITEDAMITIQIQQNRKKDHIRLDHPQNIEFPQIQSSLFDRNMPILEEDSRQQASSQLIALTNEKDKSSLNFKQQLFSNIKNNIQGSQPKIKKYQHQQLNSRHPILFEKQQNKNFKCKSPHFLCIDTALIQKPQVHITNSKTKDNKIDITDIESAQRKLKELTEDSLVGCQIPRRQSDNSDLDNFQLVSIEL